jgi:hypothetical protein
MSDDVQDIEEQAPPPLSDGVDENSDGAKAGATVLKKESTASAKSKRAILNNEIEILADQPLPQYDNGAAKAYNAQALGSEAKQQIRIFAYVCEKDMIPRARLERKMKGVINPAIAKLIGSGVVYWPPAKAQRFVFIYENNLGKPLMESVDSSNLGWKLDVVMNAVIKPMVNVFLDFRDSGIVHGNIRSTNMFDGNAAKLERVILGDCLAVPPGATQPAIFEPIERAMCDPLARGAGTMEDDLYAFGVCLTMILRTKNPQKGMTDDEIIRQKIELGSYASLTGKERFTGGILELLRGLLYDDRNQRWTLDEVMLWMEGQRLSPKQSSKNKKASRPIHFNNERYSRPAMLAMDLEKMPSEVAQLVDGGGFTQWLTRSLEDKLTYTRYEQALESASELGRGPGYWNNVLSRVSIALDPYAPMRYKDLAIHPDGLPYAFAHEVANNGNIAPYVEIVNQQLVMFWLNAQVNVPVDVGGLVSKYESCRSFLRQTSAGYGIERMLYYLLPDCPCYSDKLKGYYVLNPEDIVVAYEDISHSKDRPALFLDRHVIAFLSVKDRKVIDGYFADVNSKEEYKRILGNVKCLATIQRRSKMEMFPGITNWIADMLDPVYKRYHDRHLRVKIKDKINKLRSSGDISKMAGVLDNNNALHQDMVNFKRAMDEYKGLREERAELDRKLENPENFGKEEGREYAAIFSLILSVIVIICFTFLFLTNDGEIF